MILQITEKLSRLAHISYLKLKEVLCKLWQKVRCFDQSFCPLLIQGSYFPLRQKENKCFTGLWFLIISMSPMVSIGLWTHPPIDSSQSLWIAIVMIRNRPASLWECFIWHKDWSHIQIPQELIISVNTKSMSRFEFPVSFGEILDIYNSRLWECIN